MAKTTEAPDISRLPQKYVKYIQRLLMRVTELEGAKASVVPTRVYATDGMSDPLYLPERCTVTFSLTKPSEEQTWSRRVDVRLEEQHDGQLAVRVSGGGALVIEPEVTNVVVVKLKERG